MTAVLATYIKMSTLVDGTMRVVLDIEPTAASDAFAMLGAPGSPIALARITDAAAVAQDRKAQGASEKKPLSVASKVALRCQDPEFSEFLRTDPSGFAMEWTRAARQIGGGTGAEIAETLIKRWCGVDRKRDIESDENALRLWLEMDRDFQRWAGSRELARRVGSAA